MAQSLGARQGLDSADERLGRLRGGLTNKILAAGDANGLPIELAPAPGHPHDSLNAAELLGDIREGERLLASKAYDTDVFRSIVAAGSGWANIPPRRSRRDSISFNPFLYRDRKLVEKSFNRINHCRRIAKRYEKRATNFLAFVKLAAIPIWLRLYESTA